jgi:hypothetical protein
MKTRLLILLLVPPVLLAASLAISPPLIHPPST